MPMERDRYPSNWEAIALKVKEEAGWRCEVCGKQCRRPGEPFDTHRRTLTVAHLDHTPENCSTRQKTARARICARCAHHVTCDTTRGSTPRRGGGTG